MSTRTTYIVEYTLIGGRWRMITFFLLAGGKGDRPVGTLLGPCLMAPLGVGALMTYESLSLESAACLVPEARFEELDAFCINGGVARREQVASVVQLSPCLNRRV